MPAPDIHSIFSFSNYFLNSNNKNTSFLEMYDFYTTNLLISRTILSRMIEFVGMNSVDNTLYFA